MPKFYVSSGSVKQCIVADDPEQAFVKIFRKMIDATPMLPATPDMTEGEFKQNLKMSQGLLARLGYLTAVSEKGFDFDNDPDAIYAPTMGLLLKHAPKPPQGPPQGPQKDGYPPSDWPEPEE